MSKVYVINYSGHNIHMAEKYGELVILTEGRVNIFNTDRNIIEIAEAMPLTEHDYILISGSPVISFIVAMVASYLGLGIIQLLIYNCKKGDYELRRIFTKNIERVIKEVNYAGRN